MGRGEGWGGGGGGLGQCSQLVWSKSKLDYRGDQNWETLKRVTVVCSVFLFFFFILFFPRTKNNQRHSGKNTKYK